MEHKDVMRGVLAAAGDFNSRKLWKRFTNIDCFGVRIAGEEESMLGVVLGDAGEEYGLSLFRGPNAAASFAALIDSDGLGDDTLDDMDMLGFTMRPFGELLPEDQTFMREAGQHPRYDEQVPHFLAKPPGQRARLPHESELSLLLLVLRAVVRADQKRLLQPTKLEGRDGICVLAINGDAETPQVSVSREYWPHDGDSRTIPLCPARLDLQGLPRLDGTWLIGTPTIPAGVRGADRVMQMLLVVDEASQYMFQGRPVLGGDLREIVKIVEETFQSGGMGGRKGLPRRIVFSSRKLQEAMTPMLEPEGVECVYEPVIPELQAILADLIAYMDGDFSSAAEGAGDEGEIPAPDDLEGWKEADRRLILRFVEHFRFAKQLQSSRAVRRYFDDDDLEFYLKEYGGQGVGPAYTTWGLLDYRPNGTSKTQAEKMLAKGLPPAETLLLRARIEAYPTLYRVASHDSKAGTIDLDDVLFGAKVTVHDQLMSENIEKNLFLSARAFPAGHFHFIDLAGPPLGEGMGSEAVEFLRDCGMEFTPDGLRRDAHKFGWLWRWRNQRQSLRKPARLCNTDGEEFLWHTASFSLANPSQTRETLMERKDIDYDEEADELVWSEPAGRNNRVIGETVTLGRLEFVGDELVLTVNSAKRFAAARRWLEKLPGVAFKSVRTRRWDEAEKDRPLDERISPPDSVEMTPEIAASIQQMMDKHYMEWLDEPLPILGGRTPRQACRTGAGRQQVTILIRTIPDPTGPAPIQVPRQAMLQELGLTAETSAPPSVDSVSPPPLPIRSIPATCKIARNAPCPCGSGRKYKKCCGRQVSGR